MKLFELEMALDEGPRQDRALELFTDNLEKRSELGDTRFRAAIIDALMQEFNVTLATAANLYNYARMKQNIPDLGRTAQRAAKGLPPVVRAPKMRDPSAPNQEPAVSGDATPDANQPPAPAAKSGNNSKSNSQQLLKDTEKFNNVTDEDDIEWERYTDGNVLEISWGLQYTGMTAEEALKEYHTEVGNANHTLEKLAHKYRDKVGKIKLQTLEKAQKSDEVKGGKPAKDVQYLSGSVDFNLQ
jgi:hypothetical protein